MNKRQNSDGDPGPSQPKRLRTSTTDPASDHFSSTDYRGPSTAQLSHDDYTIAWICALPLELKASRTMFDQEHEGLPTQPGDFNTYLLGRIKHHNVVMACLPGQYGTNNAAIVATDLHRSFRNIRATLLVGIGGGAPSKDYDIRLGDVVVGTRVMQYDMGKDVGNGKFQRTGIPKMPSRLLLGAVSTIRSDPTFENRLADLLRVKLPYHRRPNQPDQLFLASYGHPDNLPTCDDCDRGRLEQRRERGSTELRVHYGGIASADTVMKNARERDELTRELSVLCFEMEAAGLMDNQCMPIRGICDYSDSHKNKAWQDHAAAAAAAYASELLGALPPAPGGPDRAETGLSMSSEHATSNVNHPSERRAQLLGSLDFLQINARVTTIQRAHTKTCRWFLRHPKYKDWLDPRKNQQTHGFLWMVGKAGAGKSTIMKFAYVETKQGYKAPGKTIASFFFNARGDFLERSITGMYRSLLFQLLKTYPNLQFILDDPDIVPSNQTDCPDLNILKELFRGAIMSLNRRSFTCFIDALDECDEQEVQDMVEFFRELVEETAEAGIHFRVCFSSRPYPYIYTGTEVLLVLEKEVGHTEDLSQYVTSRLTIKSPELRGQILEKAAGIFMWIVLVVDILNRESNRGALALERRLETIPAKLSELFKSILTRDENDVDRLLLSVLWILCANRPLSPLEFRHAVWAGELAQGDVDAVLKDNSIETAINLVTSSSKGLAEITASENPTVQFIHESVRDFLIKDNGLQEMWPDLGIEWEPSAHEKLKKCCDIYLSLEGVQSILQKFEYQDRQMKRAAAAEDYPFLEYACRQILRHADAAAVAIPQDDFIDRFLSTAGIRALNRVGPAKDRLYNSNAPPLYVLADQGLATLVRMQVQRTPATHSEEYYNQPLFAALAGGHRPSVAALLGLPSTICDGVDVTDGIRYRKDMPNRSKISRRTPLSWAAQEGKQNLTKALIQSGADVNESDKNGDTPLRLALQGRNLDLAWLLIDNGAERFEIFWLNESDTMAFFSKVDRAARARFLLENKSTPQGQWRGETVLMKAINSGSDTAARLFIAQGANIDATASDGKTAFMSALLKRRQSIAQLLIDIGADVLACVWYRRTNAFMQALEAGFEDIARHLILKGAVDIENSVGTTTLNHAIKTGNEVVIRFLIDNGAQVNLSNQDDKTPLHYAMEAGSEVFIRFLVNNGAHVNRADKDGKTVLHYAIDAGSEAVLQLLIDNGADVNHRNTDGKTVLMLASTTGQEAVAQLLIENGAQVDRLDHGGMTALMLASWKGNTGVGRLLIDNGANVHICDATLQRTALHLASGNGYESMVRLLIGKGGANVDAVNHVGTTALMEAAYCTHLDTAQTLISEGGADVNARDMNQSTALLWACWKGVESMVQLLIEGGADIEARDASGLTALMWAAAPVQSVASPPVTQLLIEKGANVEARDNFGLTALMQASAADQVHTASLLLDNGRANINARDHRGWTALMIAAYAGNTAIIALLLGRNADRLLRGGDGWTALSLARIRGHWAVARLLEPLLEPQIE